MDTKKMVTSQGKTNSYRVYALGILFFFFFSSAFAQAANLYFRPSSGSHNVGSSFALEVLVSSTDQAMNAASGIVSFPSDKLSVTSLSTSGSIINFWVAEPTFSNTAGTVQFEGVVLNPGYTGAGGKIITVHFRAKAAGNAFVSFSEGTVLANNGQGTNILSSLGNANFALGFVETTPPPVSEPDPITGRAPRITSPTHPDESKWYAESAAEFNWNVPAGVTAVRTLIGHLPEAQPTVVYDPPISSKIAEGLDDGVWYFHLQLRDDGEWTSAAHFRLQIDTTPPAMFEAEAEKRSDLTDPRVVLTLRSHDETSGIDHYEIRVPDVEPIVWKNDGTQKTTISLSRSGENDILVRAVDAAGNYLERSVRVEVMPLDAPVFTEYPTALHIGQPLIVNGTTKYPNGRVTLFVARDGEEAKTHTVAADGKGLFHVIFPERLEKGSYAMQAMVEDDRGARSNPSEAVTFRVEGFPGFQFGPFEISFYSMIMILFILLALIITITTYGGWRIAIWRRTVSREAEEAEDVLEKAFNKLYEKSEKLISAFDSSPNMSRREKKLRDEMKEALEDAEGAVKKEIKDVRKLM